MKKAALLILLALFSLTSIAQNTDKKDTTVKKEAVKPAKPEFKLNPQRVYPITLNLSLDAITALCNSPEDWQKIETSKTPSDQVYQLKQIAAAVRANIYQQRNEIIGEDYAAFMNPDSVAKAKLKKPLPKVKK